MGLRIAIDTGGTFTDVVAIDEDTGNITATKTPSTPDDPSIGLVEGVRKVLAAAGGGPSDVHMLLHGSTVATNAVLEHKFDGLGLLVTRGFRHLIEIARQSVPDGYGNSFFWVKPPRLVRLHLVCEVPGRMRFDGSELEALDEAAAINAVEELVEDGVVCIAVCLLHAYANDAHEKRVGALIAKHFPDVFVSLSSVVLPEYREYERAMTTLIDVLAQTRTAPTHRASAQPTRSPLLPQHPVPHQAVRSAASLSIPPPASARSRCFCRGRPLACLARSTQLSLRAIATFSRSTLAALRSYVSIIVITNRVSRRRRWWKSYPVKTPMLDIVTVGSGGGSVVWTDSYGQLKVGPQSAGANPGPICYGKGGKETYGHRCSGGARTGHLAHWSVVKLNSTPAPRGARLCR